MPSPQYSVGFSRRKSDGRNKSVMSTSSVRESGSDASGPFSGPTRLATEQICGDVCWACTSFPVQICHIFGKEDPQMPLWIESELVTISLSSLHSAIPLCPTCHAQFDQSEDPGFVFIPTDIQFFIDFELNDRRRRSEALRNGVITGQQVPTAAMYKEHQVKSGLIPPDAIGGLYTPTFIGRYLFTKLDIDIDSLLSKSKSWHGCPIATFRRAIPILGSPRIKILDSQTREQLTKIRDLYFVDELEPSGETIAEVTGTTQDGGKGNKRKTTHEDDDEMPPRKESKPESKNQKLATTGTTHHGNQSVKHEPYFTQDYTMDWVLGPSSSADDAVNRFSSLFALG